MQQNNQVPSFLQNYLLNHLQMNAWSPEAAFIASRYLGRSAERFVRWRQRQQIMAQQKMPLDAEPFNGTELGFRQMLYSQGAGPVFRWRGAPCFKSAYDMAIYAMLIDELRPATIIELGSGTGASALLLADLARLPVSLPRSYRSTKSPRKFSIRASPLFKPSAQNG